MFAWVDYLLRWVSNQAGGEQHRGAAVLTGAVRLDLTAFVAAGGHHAVVTLLDGADAGVLEGLPDRDAVLVFVTAFDCCAHGLFG